MSPRAAVLLEQFGFSSVFDYVGGKADWLAMGFAVEGEAASETRNRDVANESAVTVCMRKDSTALAAQLHSKKQVTAVVTGEDSVVLGLVRLSDLEAHPNTPIQDIMELGPSTFRPDGSPGDALDYMERHDVPDVVISTSYGTLVGLLTSDAARAATA